ncbi:MAG: LptF/LptG family permease [Limisphaerales bacterium]
MRLLDRYLFRELLTPFACCLGGFLVLWLATELVGEFDELQARRLTAADIAGYYAARVPGYLLIALPVSLLLAMLYALTRHARWNEVVAMRGAGWSLWRIGAPYFATGLLLSGVAFALNEFLVPDANERAEAVLRRRTDRDDEAARDWREKLNFHSAGGGRVWTIERFHVPTAAMVGPHITWPGPTGEREELIAARAGWEDGAWVFERALRLTYPPGSAVPEQFATNRLVVTAFPETPELIRSEVKISRILGSVREVRKAQLSMREILDYRRLHGALNPKDDRWLATKFHEALAGGWTSLVVVFLALPLGAGSGRRGVFLGVASSIFICFAYFVAAQFALAFGTGGHLPPWLAAWLPNAAFTALGVALILRAR